MDTWSGFSRCWNAPDCRPALQPVFRLSPVMLSLNRPIILRAGWHVREETQETVTAAATEEKQNGAVGYVVDWLVD